MMISNRALQPAKNPGGSGFCTPPAVDQVFEYFSTAVYSLRYGEVWARRNVYSAPHGYYKCTATHGTPRGTHGGPQCVVQQIPKGGYNIQGGVLQGNRRATGGSTIAATLSYARTPPRLPKYTRRGVRRTRGAIYYAPPHSLRRPHHLCTCTQRTHDSTRWGPLAAQGNTNALGRT